MKMNKVSFFMPENQFLLNDITGMEFTSLPVRICPIEHPLPSDSRQESDKCLLNPLPNRRYNPYSYMPHPSEAPINLTSTPHRRESAFRYESARCPSSQDLLPP